MADNLTATCTKCNVALHVENREDPTSPVSCPDCGQAFGTWAEVQEKLKGLLQEQFKDFPWIKVT